MHAPEVMKPRVVRLPPIELDKSETQSAPVPTNNRSLQPPITYHAEPKTPQFPGRSPDGIIAQPWFGYVVLACLLGLLLFLFLGVSSYESWSSSPKPSATKSAVSPHEHDNVVYDGTITSRSPYDTDSKKTTTVPQPSRVAAYTHSVEEQTGYMKLSAYILTKDGKRHPFRSNADILVRSKRINKQFKSHTVLPKLWKSIPVGTYSVSLTAPGYLASNLNTISIYPDQTNHLNIAMRPLPVKVDFILPTNAPVFSVYVGSVCFGNSGRAHKFEPFMSHNVTFSAPGWRTKTVRIRNDQPGGYALYRVSVEKTEPVIEISIDSGGQAAPVSAYLSANGCKPFRIDFPYKRKWSSRYGRTTLDLSVDGYKVLNSPQTVMLADHKTNRVSFIVQKNSWFGL